MDENETAARIGTSLVVLSAERPAYLRRVYADWGRRASRPEGTADTQTPGEAWDRLVGDLTPVEWLELDGPHTLDRVVRYLDPTEFDHIRGPYAVPDQTERYRLAVLLWRHLALHRGQREPLDAVQTDVSPLPRRESP